MVLKVFDLLQISFTQYFKPDFNSSCGVQQKQLTYYGIEKVQRQFTRNIENPKDHSYPERLGLLKLYSLERRRERYIVIYWWKILENIVPNLTNSIEVTNSKRRGRLCIVKQVPTGKARSLLPYTIVLDIKL